MVQSRILEQLDRLIRLSFYLLIFLLPIGIGFVSSFAGFVIFFFLIKRVCVAVKERPKGLALIKTLIWPKANALDLPIALFVGASFVSFIFSQNHGLSFVGFFGKLLRGIFLYISFLEAFNKPAQIHRFIMVWLCAGLAVSLSGLYQYVVGHDLIRNLPLMSKRVSSTLRQANDFGAYIISICPLAMALLMNWGTVGDELKVQVKKWKISSGWYLFFISVVYVALVVCLGLTLSRAAWVGFFMAILLLGCFKKETLPFILLIIVGFIWVFTPIMVATRDASLLTDNVKNIDTSVVQEDKSWIHHIYRLGSGRWAFWKEAAHIIKDYPIWGSGINTYSYLGSQYKITWGGYPHNSYLQLTAEQGFLGLLTFLWMIGIVFFLVFQRFKGIADGYLWTIAIGVLASFAAYLIQSFFDTTFYSVQLSVLLWIFMAVIVAVLRMKELTKTRS